MDVDTYYDVLRVLHTATPDEIRAAYSRLSQVHTMNTNDLDQVEEAYQTLGSPENREAYDKSLDAISTPADNEVTSLIGNSKRKPTVPLLRNRGAASDSMDTTGVDTTTALKAVVCPICSQQNAPGEPYCVECGYLLSGQQPAVAGPRSINTDLTTQPRFVDTQGVVYILRPGLNRVGRELADVMLVHKTVSRNHAVVVYDEDRVIFSVEDAGSSNGTRVNGEVLPPRSSHALNPNDEVQFGTVTLQFLGGDQEPRAEKTILQGEPEDEEGEPTVPPVPTKPIGRLTLVRGRGPQETLLGLGTLTVGRVLDNDLSLPHDRYASGHHAHIVVEDVLFRLIDLGSTNGTFLNDLRLTTNESIAMNDGDIVKIGSTMFQFTKIVEQAAKPAAEPPVTADPVDAGPNAEMLIEELPLSDAD